MQFRQKLSDQDFLDGDICGPAQKVGFDLCSENAFVTIADQDHEMFYYDSKANVWRENAYDLIWRWLAKRYPAFSKHMRNEVIDFVQGQTLERRENFQTPPGWVSFKNQCINAKANYALEYDASDNYIRNRYPVNFNNKAVCPQFSLFLNQVLPDLEDRTTLIEALSMVLIPQFNFEKAVMFIGTSSANGKSTIMKVMRALFGKDNICAISLQDLIYNRFMGQKLDGKLLNIYADINDKEITDLDKFKLFISGDLVTVERKNGHPYEIEAKAKHFFSTNTLPEIKEDNTAVYRRFLIIEFPVSFEDDKDLDLLAKLTTKEELEGIMWLLLRTAKRMSVRRNFTYPQSPDEIRMRWKNESNAVFELINNSVQITKYSDYKITRQAFYTEYARFCHSKKYTVKSQGTVTRQVEKLGISSHKSNGVWYWLGIGVPKEVKGNETL